MRNTPTIPTSHRRSRRITVIVLAVVVLAAAAVIVGAKFTDGPFGFRSFKARSAASSPNSQSWASAAAIRAENGPVQEAPAPAIDEAKALASGAVPAISDAPPQSMGTGSPLTVAGRLQLQADLAKLGVSPVTIDGCIVTVTLHSVGTGPQAFADTMALTNQVNTAIRNAEKSGGSCPKPK